jgi:hypothetical protein
MAVMASADFRTATEGLRLQADIPPAARGMKIKVWKNRRQVFPLFQPPYAARQSALGY